jgi:hypothetical protein
MGGVQTLSRDGEKPGSSGQILYGARTYTKLSGRGGRKIILGKELTRLSATVEEDRKKRGTVFQSRDALR